MQGRNAEGTLYRPLTYRAKTPSYWSRKESPTNESLVDTRKPLVEYFIQEEGLSIRITLHNFPANSLEERISPQSQINRWKKQFDPLVAETIHTSSLAKGGFSGLFFEASGLQDQIETTVLGWSMQLSAEHFRNLSHYAEEAYRQMRADYTLKAVGPSDLIFKHKFSIIEFANSFELIEEIPSST